MRVFLAALMLLGVSSMASAQTIATVQQSDAQELNRILTEQVPAKWAEPVAKWFNALVARQADEDAKKKAAETSKPNSPPEPHKP